MMFILLAALVAVANAALTTVDDNRRTIKAGIYKTSASGGTCADDVNYPLKLEVELYLTGTITTPNLNTSVAGAKVVKQCIASQSATANSSVMISSVIASGTAAATVNFDEHTSLNCNGGTFTEASTNSTTCQIMWHASFKSGLLATPTWSATALKPSYKMSIKFYDAATAGNQVGMTGLACASCAAYDVVIFRDVADATCLKRNAAVDAASALAYKFACDNGKATAYLYTATGASTCASTATVTKEALFGTEATPVAVRKNLGSTVAAQAYWVQVTSAEADICPPATAAPSAAPTINTAAAAAVLAAGALIL